MEEKRDLRMNLISTVTPLLRSGNERSATQYLMHPDTSVDTSNKNLKKLRHWKVQLRDRELEVIDPLSRNGKVIYSTDCDSDRSTT